jgi:hypothetical protein
MKLRIKGNSLRLRVAPSEMARLLDIGRIEETIHFGPEEEAKLTYALEHRPQSAAMTVRYQSREVTVVVRTQDAHRWAAEEELIGLYGEFGIGDHRLDLAVEKDFACLDSEEPENKDTYPNPKQGAAC